MRITKSPWFLQFSVVPKAEPLEVEITHSIKNTEQTTYLWDYLERKKDPHSPHNLVWVLVSLYTSAAIKKNQKINFIPFLFSIKCSYAHKILTHPMNMRWLFSSTFFKIKRHQYPFIYVLEVSHNHHQKNRNGICDDHTKEKKD